MDMNSYFKCLIYKKILKVHKFVVHKLVNFVFFAYLCIRNQVKRLSHICKYIFTFKEF